MSANRDRLKYLVEKIRQVNAEIQNKGLHIQYLEVSERIAGGTLEPKIISEEMWEEMPPEGKKENLIFFYYALRAELKMLLDEIEIEKLQADLEKAESEHEKRVALDKLTAFLDHQYVRRGIVATVIVGLARSVVEKTKSLFTTSSKPPHTSISSSPEQSSTASPDSRVNGTEQALRKDIQQLHQRLREIRRKKIIKNLLTSEERVLRQRIQQLHQRLREIRRKRAEVSRKRPLW